MESNNISTKIVSVLIPLIIVLVVLVPFTTAITGGGGEGPKTIIQEGAFMKEINLDELDKSQEYVIADINTQTYKDRQLVAYIYNYNEQYTDELSPYLTDYACSIYYGTWVDSWDDSISKTGFMIDWEGINVIIDGDEDSTYTYYQDIGSADGESVWTAEADVMEQIKLWYVEDDSWYIGGPGNEAWVYSNTLFIATTEPTEYVGVHSKNYNNEYYIDENSSVIIWSSIMPDKINEWGVFRNMARFNQNTWVDGIVGKSVLSSIEHDVDSSLELMGYVEYSPLTVTVDNSNVKIGSRWNFDILGENIDFNDYDTSFTGIVPYKVTIEGGEGGVSGPTGTLIQMIPIFALLGIPSALIIPMIRKEESI